MLLECDLQLCMSFNVLCKKWIRVMHQFWLMLHHLSKNQDILMKLPEKIVYLPNIVLEVLWLYTLLTYIFNIFLKHNTNHSWTPCSAVFMGPKPGLWKKKMNLTFLVFEMIFLLKIMGVTRLDKIRNDNNDILSNFSSTITHSILFIHT